MARCTICGKGRQFGISRTHKRGVAGGQWKKKAPKTQKIFKANLQRFGKKMYCVKCLRKVKGEKRESGVSGESRELGGSRETGEKTKQKELQVS